MASNPFRYYVMVETEGRDPFRYQGHPNSMRGRIKAEIQAGQLSALKGIDAWIVRERKNPIVNV